MSFGKAGAALAVVVVLVVIAVPQLSRPGYSADEEFTVFAVRGIATDQLPLLPSGLLYDRGLAYSYAGWVAHALTGEELPAYRALALISAIASLVVIFRIVQRHATTNAAIIAMVLVAASIPFWAVATSGRFYAPFLFLYLCALGTLGTLLIRRSREPRAPTRLAPLARRTLAPLALLALSSCCPFSAG